LFLFSAAACSPEIPDCERVDVFCVGIVTNIGKITDRSFNQSAWEAALQARTDLGAQVHYIESVDPLDYEKNIGFFAESGFDVIVTVGYSMQEATISAAWFYPNIDFIGIDQVQEYEIADLAGVIFPEDQAGFLAGALASMMSQTHEIGAVCGPDSVPPVWRYGEGYRAGAAYADALNNTVTRVRIIYHPDNDNAFTDPEWGAETAVSLTESGVDILFGCGGITGNAAVNAAAKAGAYVIGVDTDQYLTLPDAAPNMLTSATKLITPAVFELIKRSKEGTFPKGNYFGNAGIAPYHDLENEVPSQVTLVMEQLQVKLSLGLLTTNVPPEKPE